MSGFMPYSRIVIRFVTETVGAHQTIGRRAKDNAYEESGRRRSATYRRSLLREGAHVQRDIPSQRNY